MRTFNKMNQTAVTQPVYVVQFNRIIGGLSSHKAKTARTEDKTLWTTPSPDGLIRVTDVEVSVIIKGFAQNSFFAEDVDARSL